MAQSSEYHKRSHSRSEILWFSCALKMRVLCIRSIDVILYLQSPSWKWLRKVQGRGPSTGPANIGHSLHWLLQSALCCYQTAKARTLCVCEMPQFETSFVNGDLFWSWRMETCSEVGEWRLVLKKKTGSENLRDQSWSAPRHSLCITNYSTQIDGFQKSSGT